MFIDFSLAIVFCETSFTGSGLFYWENDAILNDNWQKI